MTKTPKAFEERGFLMLGKASKFGSSLMKKRSNLHAESCLLFTVVLIQPVPDHLNLT